MFRRLTDTFVDLMSNPTSRYATFGASFRWTESMIIVYFMPAFFATCYPLMQMEYSMLNAVVKGLGGFLSVIVCGILSDRFEKRDRMIKSKICIGGAIVAIPFMAGCCLIPGVSFYVSLACFAIKFLVSEGYMAPTVTMIQSTVKPEN
jgi:MFS family permease